MEKKARWRDYFITLGAAILLALVVRSFLLTAYKVPTGSMQPTLKPGDFIFTYRPAYGFKIPGVTNVIAAKLPSRGDLVVFTYPKQPDTSYVKRVVAIPGDRVELKQGRLILNETPLNYEMLKDQAENPNEQMFDIFLEKETDLPESSPNSLPSFHQRRVIFEKKSTSQDFGPLVVPPNEVFLLGDNRDASDDSRYWGTVPISEISGRVLFIWLSLDWQNKWGGDRFPRVRWNRVFSTTQ